MTQPIAEAKRSHYAILGIEPDAAPEQIQRAWLRTVREFDPENHPQTFMAAQEARQTLSDPVLRADYDAHLRHGEELARYTAEANEFFGQEKFAEAIRPLKDILVLHPGALFARNMLGTCFSRTSQWQEGRKAFARLTTLKNDEPGYWYNFGMLCLREAGTQDDSEAKKRLCSEARKHLEMARSLDPKDPDYTISIGQTFESEQEFSQAAVEAEAAVRLTPVPNVDVYFFLARMYDLTGMHDDVLKTADRLAEALSSAESRDYAGQVFATFAHGIYERHMFPTALRFIRAAARINPADESIGKAKESWEQAQVAFDVYDHMAKDPIVIQPVRHLLALLTDENCNLKSSVPREQVLQTIAENLNMFDGSAVAAAGRRIRDEYPALYKLAPAEIDKYIRMGPAPVQSPPPRPAVVVQSSASAKSETVFDSLLRKVVDFFT